MVKDRFYWLSNTSDVTSWIEKCGCCKRRQSPTDVRAPLVNIKSTYPLELVSTDFLTVDPCTGGIRNILVITDHFTEYAVAVHTKYQTAKTTAEALLNNFIVHYGGPAKLLSDQGSNFESEVIQELCKLIRSHKAFKRSTIYYPNVTEFPKGLIELCSVCSGL